MTTSISTPRSCRPDSDCFIRHNQRPGGGDTLPRHDSMRTVGDYLTRGNTRFGSLMIPYGQRFVSFNKVPPSRSNPLHEWCKIPELGISPSSSIEPGEMPSPLRCLRQPTPSRRRWRRQQDSFAHMEDLCAKRLRRGERERQAGVQDASQSDPRDRQRDSEQRPLLLQTPGPLAGLVPMRSLKMVGEGQQADKINVQLRRGGWCVCVRSQ